MTDSLPSKSAGLAAKEPLPDVRAQLLQLATGKVVHSGESGLSYTCQHCICSGEFGSVWYCTENGKGIYCALKIAPARCHGDTSPRIHHERSLANQAKEKYMPTFIESSRAVLAGQRGSDLRIIATEFLDGVCAKSLCAVGAMPWPVASRILADILNALALLHLLGIVHGAVRTERVVVTPAGRSYLCDFAYTSERDPLSFPAPELQGQRPENTSKTDIWGFGVLATKIATGTGISSTEVDDGNRGTTVADFMCLGALATKIAAGAGMSMSLAPAKSQEHGPGQKLQGEPTMAPRVPQPAGFPKAFGVAVRSCLQAKPEDRVTSEKLQQDFSKLTNMNMYRDVNDYMMYYDIIYGGA